MPGRGKISTGKIQKTGFAARLFFRHPPCLPYCTAFCSCWFSSFFQKRWLEAETAMVLPS